MDKSKRIISLLLCFVMLLGFVPPINVFAADGGDGGLEISSPSDGGTINGFETVRIKWNKYSGADHYWITIKDEKTGNKPINEECSGTTYRVYSDDEVFTEDGREYKIYVAAMDENGAVLNDGSAWHAIYVTNELELETPEITSHSYTDTHCVDDALYVSWDTVDCADDYTVYVKKLDKEPDFGSTNESGTNITYTWSDDCEIKVAASKLVADKWYKIALCATNTDQDIDSEWTEVYILMQEADYLNVSEYPDDLGAEKGSSSSFWIESNLEWEVSCDASWLTWTINQKDGTHTEIIVETTSANTGTSDREAEFTISADGVDDEYVCITQLAPEIELPSFSNVTISGNIMLGEEITWSADVSGNGSLLKTVSVGIYSKRLDDSVFFRNVNINEETYSLNGSVATGGVVSGYDESGNAKTLDMSLAGEYAVTLHAATDAAKNNYAATEPVTIILSEHVGTGILGDVNSDGVVTNKDRFILNRYLAGMDGYTLDMINFEAADIDKDLALTDRDCTILIRHLANWTGYENLNQLSSVITGNHGTGSVTCPPHTAVGGQTVYSHHVYDEILDNNSEHQISAIVWDCVCGVCGESFVYEATEGYEGYLLPQKEAHTYDQHGICTVCLHRCTHNYVATDRVVKNTGKWENRGDGTHVRTSVMYIFKCSDCGAETRKYVNEPETPLSHTARYDDHTLSVTQLDTSNIDCYLKHQVKVDRWIFCSARNQGCDYSVHVGEVTLLKNHNFVDGLCACGFSEEQAPLMAKDATGETFYIKWDHDSVKEFVTEEHIKIYTSGSGKYFGIAFYDKNGNGVSGSSSSGKFQFTLISNSSEYVDGNRVYKDFSHKQLNGGKNYIAMQQDNYTFHCNESGKFAIKVTVDGKGCGAIQVEVVKTDSNLIPGSSLYEEGDYGYSKVVAAPANILNLSNGAEKRLWFDLNTPLGELKLIENMPTYEFEFIDEEKDTLQGWWQLVCLSGVRNGVTTIVDLPKEVIKAVVPDATDLIDLMEANDENREMARRIATFLEEVDYNTLEKRLPTFSTATLDSLAYSESGLNALIEFLNQLDEYILKEELYIVVGGKYALDEARLVNMGIKENIQGLLLYYKNNKLNANVFKNFKSISEMADDFNIKSQVFSCGLSMLFAELETAGKKIRADMVLDEIESGILDLDGVSAEMKNAVIEVLKDDSVTIDEKFVNATDAVAETAGSFALDFCPPAKAVYWTLAIGSSLLGYESFEDALKDLLEQNEKYDQAKTKLQTALIAYKNGKGTYSQVNVAMNEYKLIAADCIYLYEALRTAEASSPIKLLCTEEQSYIDAAESTTRYSNEKLLKYMDYLKTGALKP